MTFQEAIEKYLDQVAESDELFKPKYDKSKLKQCCDFICNKVREKNVQCLTDDEVYQLAKHYFEEDIKDVKPVDCKVVISKEQLTDEDRKFIEEESKRQIEQAKKDLMENEIANIKKSALDKEIEKKKKIEAQAKKEKKQKEEVGQLSLFGDDYE